MVVRLNSPLAPRRIGSIDIVRGVVMVVMALDHVRDWVTNVRFPPEDLSQSSPALIVEEAGGKFTDAKGRKDLFSGSALFSNGHLHDAVLELMR